jgi:tetratricopeptide (TPR) repeat protein
MDMLFQKHMPDGRGYYGYGWEINEMRVGNTNDRVQTIGHDGTINGYCSLITRILSDDLVVVLLNNTGEAPLYEMTVAINGILHDKPYDMPRKSLAYALLNKIKKDGLAGAPAYYASVKDSHDYKINETEMNYAGYDLLHAGKAKEAAYVFKLNTEAFPNSYNAYDSYAETLLATGDKDQAIANYLKSVRLNPLSESGLNALKRLGVNTDTLFKKVSLEYLRSLEGKYLWKEGDKEWNIEFKVVNGTLMGSDRGYEYKVLPVADNTFVNPDDGASIVFDTKDKKEISVVLFGRVKFKKIK